MFLKSFLVALPTFLIIDMIWLGFLARGFYDKYLGHFLGESVDWFAAITLYVFFVIALVFFVIVPSLKKKSEKSAVLYGAFFGFITYATYDLTNLATLEGWPVVVVFVDIAWGSLLGASVSAITYFIVNKFLQ